MKCLCKRQKKNEMWTTKDARDEKSQMKNNEKSKDESWKKFILTVKLLNKNWE